MTVWTVANQKGGVGKTTTAVALASLLARHSYPTLLVDMDPHASATAYLLGATPAPAGGGGVTALFDAADGATAVDATRLVEPLAQPGLAMLRASPELAGLERRFAVRGGMGRVLRDALASLGPETSHVVIDCPPTLGLLLVNALAAADHVIVPVQTEHLALHGLQRMLETLEMIERSQRRNIPRTIVPTLFDPRTRASRDALATLRAQGHAGLWDGVIPVDTRLRDASQAGEPAPVYCPGGRAVVAYDRLLQHLLAGTAVPAHAVVSW